MIKFDVNIAENWIDELRPFTTQGACADYIPALAETNPKHLGVCVMHKDGTIIRAGDWDVSFTMQSISKVFGFIVACMECGLDQVLNRVGVEPTGDEFNSIIRLEIHEPGKPFNPFINAGAITVSSMIPGDSASDKLEPILMLLEKIVGRSLLPNSEVFQSEWETGDLNRAIAYYLKENGFLASSVDVALKAYFQQCSIEITLEELAKLGFIVANDGIHPWTDEQLIPKEITKMTKALMLTCGMYNQSGKYAAFVGVPAKSGVSGGILVSIPATGSPITPSGIGIYGPAVNASGNSVAGGMLLQRMVKEWELGIF